MRRGNQRLPSDIATEIAALSPLSLRTKPQLRCQRHMLVPVSGTAKNWGKASFIFLLRTAMPQKTRKI